MASDSESHKPLIIGQFTITDKSWWNAINSKLILRDPVLNNVIHKIQYHPNRRLIAVSYLYSYYYQHFSELPALFNRQECIKLALLTVHDHLNMITKPLGD